MAERGQASADPRFSPEGDAALAHAAAGFRLQPLGHPRGPWAAAHAGAGRTRDLTRPMFDAAVGWDFPLGAGQLAVGPTFGVVHVFQPDDALRPADANILVAGIHGVWQTRSAPSRDVDTDRDGIFDRRDRCRLDPEDKDDFEDEDGCPDDDNDKDQIPDRRDRCPLVPEDKDGFEDADGCPENDNDKDGIVDARDRCPNVPEDKDGFEDGDGCPDEDNDNDGILDPKDLCPNEPETKNGYADEDGCPDSEQVRVVGDKIVLDDRVHFWTNSAQIRPVSYPLLQRVAELIQQNPSYVHVEVQGHTDERGPEWFNKKLSEERAQSVQKFLVTQGITESRLSARGFGSEKPLADKKSERAWFMNRRVEFFITREVRTGTPSGTPNGTPSEGESQ
ncbi:MAG: OmpA family protein [Polyangiaceae bacterium]